VLNESDQRAIHAILQAATEIQVKNIILRLQRVPGRCDDPSHDGTDWLAKLPRTLVNGTLPHDGDRQVALISKNVHPDWEQENQSSIKGAHLRKSTVTSNVEVANKTRHS
jgi:hypothetical protein